MIMNLIEALKGDLQKAYEDVFRITSTGEYKQVGMYLIGLPTRDATTADEPTILFVPVAGEDNSVEGEEVLTLDLICCVYVPHENEGGTPAPEEASRDLVNMIEVIKRYIRANTTVGGCFQFSGKMSWTYQKEYGDQPEPYYFAALRVEYKAPIINGMTKKEVNIYGSSY